MIGHTLTVSGGTRPSRFGGVEIHYRCACGAEFTSASPEPLCPEEQEYRDGRRDGADDRRHKRRQPRPRLLSRSYRLGYVESRGQAPLVRHPNARLDPEGHRESRMAATVAQVRAETADDRDE
jgi:hypothetical protein